MTVYNSDVLRLEGTETGLHGAMRNRQDGYATDTKKHIHKFSDGSIVKYVPEDDLALWGATGIQGQQGATGPRGAGATGLGYTGLAGPTGVQGVTGPSNLYPDKLYNGYGDVLIDTSGADYDIYMGDTGTIEDFNSNECHMYNDLSIQYSGETGGIRWTRSGTKQQKFINDSGGPINKGYLLVPKTDNYPNGVDIAGEDATNVIAINGSDAVYNGEWFWGDIEGPSVARFTSVTGLQGGLGFKGELFGMANTYGLSNNGKAKCWTGLQMGNAMGYCLEDSPLDSSNYTNIYIQRMPNGISGRIEQQIDGFSSASYVDMEYHKEGNTVTIKFPAFSATSDQAYIQFSNWIEVLRPALGTCSSTIPGRQLFIDNGAAQTFLMGYWHYTNSGQAELYCFNASGLFSFTASGTKGWGEPLSFTYVI